MLCIYYLFINLFINLLFIKFYFVLFWAAVSVHHGPWLSCLSIHVLSILRVFIVF